MLDRITLTISWFCLSWKKKVSVYFCFSTLQAPLCRPCFVPRHWREFLSLHWKLLRIPNCSPPSISWQGTHGQYTQQHLLKRNICLWSQNQDKDNSILLLLKKNYLFAICSKQVMKEVLLVRWHVSYRLKSSVKNTCLVTGTITDSTHRSMKTV